MEILEPRTWFTPPQQSHLSGYNLFVGVLWRFLMLKHEWFVFN
jgi:hypothetical protein